MPRGPKGTKERKNAKRGRPPTVSSPAVSSTIPAPVSRRKHTPHQPTLMATPTVPATTPIITTPTTAHDANTSSTATAAVTLPINTAHQRPFIPNVLDPSAVPQTPPRPVGSSIPSTPPSAVLTPPSRSLTTTPRTERSPTPIAAHASFMREFLQLRAEKQTQLSSMASVVHSTQMAAALSVHCSADIKAMNAEYVSLADDWVVLKAGPKRLKNGENITVYTLQSLSDGPRGEEIELSYWSYPGDVPSLPCLISASYLKVKVYASSNGPTKYYLNEAKDCKTAFSLMSC